MFDPVTNSGYSYTLATGDGFTKSFTFGFTGYGVGYLNANDIHVYVLGHEVPNTVNPSTPNRVDLETAPPLGEVVLIRRIQPLDRVYSDFERGNVYNKDQINNSFLNQLYISHQFLDGFFDGGDNDDGDEVATGNLNMRGFKIYNLAKNTNDPHEAVRQDKVFAIEDRVSGLENSLTDLKLTSVPWSPPVAVQGQTIFVSPLGVVNPIVWVNGVLQDPLKGDFTINKIERQIIFAEPLDAGDRVFAMLGDPLADVRAYSMSSYARVWWPANAFRPKLTDGSTIMTHRPQGKIETPAHAFFSDKVRSATIVAITPPDMPIVEGVEMRFMVSGENSGNTRWRIETAVQGPGEFAADYTFLTEFTVAVRPQDVTHYRAIVSIPAADITQTLYLRVSRVPTHPEDTLATSSEDAFFIGIALNYVAE
ncbi:tail fiber protein [Pseudomonas phage Achelous]|uniref:Tail fiber protein n=1 Tax=Pseudomonas phage Achelous TaxID=2163982 RepID=A0A2S1GMV8_9CAUD|nr:tail fiber protein [Pseudomonas phage Achelous]AWD90715.1 tail fiber protein [Pseudomonas phage Achelous]